MQSVGISLFLKMNIWILTSSKKNFKKHSNLRYIEELSKFPEISFKLVLANDVEICLDNGDKDKSRVFFKGRKTDLPDVVIPKMASYATYFSLALIRQFEQLGVLVLNSANSIEQAKDKLQSLQILSAHGLPIPKTIFAKFPINKKFIEKQLKYPFIMKKVSGSLGKGVLLIKNAEQLESVMGLVEEQIGSNQLNLIFQEFIEFSEGRDLRVIVVGGKVIGVMQRTAIAGNFRANVAAGGSVKKFDLSPEIEWLAVEAANILNLGIAGVDLLFTKEGGYKICEVNSSPQFEGFEKATGVNVPAKVLEFLKIRTQNY